MILTRVIVSQRVYEQHMGRSADELQRDDNQLRCVGEPDKLEECFKSVLDGEPADQYFNRWS